MFPMYREIEGPLVAELLKRGGKSRPQDKGDKGRDVYEALAEHFQLTREEKDECIYENGNARSKWHNMVRYAVRKLRAEGILENIVQGEHGVWKVAG